MDYEYKESGPRYPDAYVADPILGLCRSLGVRRVLDLGCGNGELCRRLAADGFDVVGCDPSPSGIEVARLSVPDVPFKTLGVYDEPSRLAEAPFDAVVAMEVVEHLYLPRHLPRFAKTVLKPGGHLILSTPYHGYLKNLGLSALGRWDAHLSPLWDGGHVKFWSRRTIRALVEPEGFVFDRFVGAGRIPWLWKSMVVVFRRPG